MDEYSALTQIALALAGGLAGALLAYWLQISLTMQSEDTSALNDHISDIVRIERLAIEYWSQAQNQQFLALEAQLEGALTATAYFNQDAKRMLGGLHKDYMELDGQLFDAATGGDFQSGNRAADFSRVVEIVSVCNRLRALLRQGRRQQYRSV